MSVSSDMYNVYQLQNDGTWRLRNPRSLPKDEALLLAQSIGGEMFWENGIAVVEISYSCCASR